MFNTKGRPKINLKAKFSSNELPDKKRQRTLLGIGFVRNIVTAVDNKEPSTSNTVGGTKVKACQLWLLIYPLMLMTDLLN
jgi:hypothetical protein